MDTDWLIFAALGVGFWLVSHQLNQIRHELVELLSEVRGLLKMREGRLSDDG